MNFEEDFTQLEQLLIIVVYLFIAVFTYYKQKEVMETDQESSETINFVLCFLLGLFWIITIPIYLGKRLIGNWKE